MTRDQLNAAPEYFKIPELFKAFAVGCLDGQVRQIALGITQRHYRDNVLAASWYKNIREELSACRIHLPKKEYMRITDLAGKLFESMVK